MTNLKFSSNTQSIREFVNEETEKLSMSYWYEEKKSFKQIKKPSLIKSYSEIAT